MVFNPTSLFYTDGYKIGHRKMLAPGTTKLYGTWIPRTIKYAPTGVTKIVSFGQQLVVQWLHDEFTQNFFALHKDEVIKFGKDMSLYLGIEYDASHFEDLYDLGYLPIRIKSLPEGIETDPNIPHMTFINTVDGFAWLTLYLETIISSLAWKPATSATLALQYKRNVVEWVMKTDPASVSLIPFLAHDFSARGLSPWDMLSSGLGHATSFRGSDSIIVIPGARHYYHEPETETCINSVNASEHSVSTTCIFTMGESDMLKYFMDQYPTGILSLVSDTFNLWDFITEYLPANKDQIMARDGKVVVRPDSGDPCDILCGYATRKNTSIRKDGLGIFYADTDDSDKPISDWTKITDAEYTGVIEALWNIFGGTINAQGFKVLDSHIGAIYGDTITLARQLEIYSRLALKGFASTNIVLGIGSYTYQFNTRDTFGFAAKGSWFEVGELAEPTQDNSKLITTSYSIYKDPITDDGTKKSLKGLCSVHTHIDHDGVILGYFTRQECTQDEETKGILQTIYENGKFYNEISLTQIRENLDQLVNYSLPPEGSQNSSKIDQILNNYINQSFNSSSY